MSYKPTAQNGYTLRHKHSDGSLHCRDIEDDLVEIGTSPVHSRSGSRAARGSLSVMSASTGSMINSVSSMDQFQFVGSGGQTPSSRHRSPAPPLPLSPMPPTPASPPLATRTPAPSPTESLFNVGDLRLSAFGKPDHSTSRESRSGSSRRSSHGSSGGIVTPPSPSSSSSRLQNSPQAGAHVAPIMPLDPVRASNTLAGKHPVGLRAHSMRPQSPVDQTSVAPAAAPPVPSPADQPWPRPERKKARKPKPMKFTTRRSPTGGSQV